MEEIQQTLEMMMNGLQAIAIMCAVLLVTFGFIIFTCMIFTVRDEIKERREKRKRPNDTQNTQSIEESNK